MTVLAIGDIGVVSDMMHIGDEAMFEAARDELAGRGVDVVAVSSEPEESARRYGLHAVGRLGFAGLDRAQARRRSTLLRDVAGGAASLPAGDPAAGVMDVLDDAAGLINTGGGNLASRWPVHVDERTTLASMARARGLPVVVTGQTFGPDLIPEDAALVADMVRSASLTGVRERDSAARVRAWGAHAALNVDDASFLRADASAEAEGAVLVSLSGWFAGRDASAVEAAVAGLLDHAARNIGPVVFHAHFGQLDHAGAPAGDAALHERIRVRMAEPSRVVPTGDSRAAAGLARGARFLVTGRYHPAVFAAPAGVPVLALAADDYTRIKLGGALAHWGQDAVLDLDDLDADGAGRLDAVADRADELRVRAADRFEAHRAAATRWWDAVAAVFAG